VCAGATVTVVELRSAGRRPWYDALPPRSQHAAAADRDAVAYTLFTSGSTGTPKGVPIRHRNLARYLAYAIDRYEVGPGSRLSQTFELTFDPSVFDMFVAWCSGATLVVARPDDLMTPVRFVNDNEITHWFCVPSVASLAMRLRALRPGCMPDLRWSLFCGEQLTLGQARAWAQAAPASVLENLYGPTELTVTCTGYRLPRDREQWPRTSNDTVPIGAVYAHLDGVLLDGDGLEAVEGELCVRGPQRFDGYLDAAQDEGRFVRHEGQRTSAPAGPPAPDDWYRTGDRVRLEDGALVHLGRLDDQVKLHGYRVELGEIEAVLRAHGAVHDVVVLALGKGPQLHAVYTGDGVDERELAELVRGRLPAYMSPRRYVRVDRLPLNANGKIDRRALAAEAGL
jgi:amino acid adenylation domain-containing protein